MAGNTVYHDGSNKSTLDPQFEWSVIILNRYTLNVLFIGSVPYLQMVPTEDNFNFTFC